MAIINLPQAAKITGFSERHLRTLFAGAPADVKAKLLKLPNRWLLDDALLSHPYFKHSRPGKKPKVKI